MRPVRLDLDGFASFRQPTSISFDDVDFFALVGPTGSGKSTVIDAIVFALYGTAPRWGRRNAIEYALAPTKNRCTVRLVFDLGERRYEVAREVRRTGKSIQQKTTSLEVQTDPDNPDLNQVIAADPKAIAEQIEKLLGLSYEDFTQCVVLPQGQFADFLKAKNADRQDILLKLLGADRYERIRRAAGERHSAARTRAEALTAHLDSLGDATAQALGTARARVRELATGLAAVDRLSTAHTAAADRVDDAEADLSAAQARRATLAAVRAPEGLRDAQATAAQTRATLTAAQGAATEAARAHRAARAALDQAGDRRVLDARLAAWERHATLTADLPRLARARTAAGQALTDARTAREAARTAQAAAAEAQANAETAARIAADDEGRLSARLATLTAVAVPAGVTELAGRVRAATTTDEQARAALAEADREQDASDAAVAADEPVSVLARAEQLCAGQATQQTSVTRLAQAAEQAEHTTTEAETRLGRARAAEQEATTALKAARTADLAATVRAGLADGADCPVCGNAFHGAPEEASGAGLAAAQAARDTARAALEEARDQWDQARSTAGRAADQADAARSRLRELADELGTVLPGADPDTIADRLQQARTAADRADAARTGQTAARKAVDTASRQLRQVQEDAGRARATLHAATAPLLALGYQPTSGQADLVLAWEHLTGWAQDQAGTATRNHADASAARAVADQTTRDAGAEHARTQKAATTAQDAVTEASVADDAATRAHESATTDLADLTTELTGQPDADRTRAELAELDRLTAQEKSALTRADQATAAAEAAREADYTAHQVLRDSRNDLNRLLDALAGQGAPSVDPGDLGTAWATLTGWATTELDELDSRRLPASRQAVTNAQAGLDTATGELATHLAGLGLPPVTPITAHTAQLAVASAQAGAQSRLEDTERRARERDRVQADLDAAQEQVTVTGELERLLRANNFQKWLAGAALETLVAGACDALRELSGGQFDLTHDNGEFFVIDHIDADAQRSVRTLSGGETFQASLALALTLSDQLSSLQTTGAARLESIFLDEGFGTLDADSLDVVAATLERLTQSERMVGIVTHVAALAERVPVRFAVTRDAAGSRVGREEQ